MAGAVDRKVSAASARAHTRRSKQSSSIKLPSGMLKKIVAVLFVGVSAWVYQSIQPPPPKICGTLDGPPVTAPRIKLRDGRHLAYKEHGIPRDKAKHKVIYVHGIASSRDNAVCANTLSPDIINMLGVYIVSFDRPGYAESDPDPKRTTKSIALDIEELADHLGLGSKFYIIGFSMGGQVVWTCLKHIPHRLAGAALIAPVVNYWWPNLPANVSNDAFYRKKIQDQWALRVTHFAPWLTYWWNTQKMFPPLSLFAGKSDVLSHQDKELLAKGLVSNKHEAVAKQQGVFESLHRDLIFGFGTWEYDPIDLENPFTGGEGSVHLWQGEEDLLVPATLQRYIVKQLPWIHYHEVPHAGHLFPNADGMCNSIVKTLLTGEKNK